jgi:hypothetical protein
MKKLLFLLVWALPNVKILGQTVAENAPAIPTTKPVHALGLSVGLSHTALKTEVISPLVFSGTGVPLSLTYRREGAKSKQYVQLQYQSPTLNSPFDFRMTVLDVFLGYGYLRKIKSFPKMNPKMNLYVGGEVQIMGSFRQMPQVGSNNTQAVMLNGLHLSSLLDYSLGEHRLEAHLSVAALSYNLRTKDNFKIGAFEENFSQLVAFGAYVETLPNYLNTSLRLSYIPPLKSKHWRWRVDYWGNFQRFQQRQYMGVLQNQISTSLTYQF